MEKKVTTMELKVNLQCCRCHKKVKKVLCKFPQIRDQKYDEKANTVTITVVSCCPEKIRDKICRKGGQYIECITIIKPPPEPPKPKPPKPEPPKPEPPKPPKPEPPKPPKPEPPKPPPTPKPSPPDKFCCMICYHRHVWGPCYIVGTPPHPCSCGCGGSCGGGGSCGCRGSCGGGGSCGCRGSCGGGGNCGCRGSCGCGGSGGCGNKPYYVSRGDCLCEENPQACTNM